jgi:hypothetical protein
MTVGDWNPHTTKRVQQKRAFRNSLRLMTTAWPVAETLYGPQRLCVFAVIDFETKASPVIRRVRTSQHAQTIRQGLLLPPHVLTLRNDGYAKNCESMKRRMIIPLCCCKAENVKHRPSSPTAVGVRNPHTTKWIQWNHALRTTLKLITHRMTSCRNSLRSSAPLCLRGYWFWNKSKSCNSKSAYFATRSD